ncbi:MAG TPA: POT family MFS transporter [Lacipirellulaceae bacterium]|nr:POT family MFS transporter [Lacipirellulaceae bacterium]
MSSANVPAAGPAANAPDRGPRTTPWPTDKMPPGIPYIIGNEAAERFSYYGITSILTIFLTEHVLGVSGEPAHLDNNRAQQVTHDFFAWVYFFPIVGALLSDGFLGKYRMIVSVSLLYCVGHAVMAISDHSWRFGIAPLDILWWGMLLVAIGAGGIKPCVSAHVGDQFGAANKHLVPRIFGWFYFSINFGSTFATILMPKLLTWYGPGIAFGVPGVLMAVATAVFWIGRNKYVHIPAGGIGFLRESFSKEGLFAILNLAPLFLLLAPFWGLFDQSHSAWVNQAKEMNCHFLGLEIDPAQIQSVNPLLVLIFIPLFSYWLYPFLGRFFEVTPLKKIGIGHVLMIPSYALISYAQQAIDAGGTPSMWWQVGAYVFLTAAEVMISITGLEFAYTQSPRKMKSLVMGVFLLSISLGNVLMSKLNGYIADRKEEGRLVLQGADFYWFCTAAIAITGVVFVIYAQFYRGRTYIQGAEDSETA